tara:strand:- start:10191 stop:11006 length:816 start_codon:yes stop_codon:yes gene_type:complete
MIDLTTLNIVSFLLIFFIGLPHGSFDGAVASLVGFKTKNQFIKFLLYYLILFLFVILFWIYFPIVALSIFLLMTIAHFGLCDWSNFKISKYKLSISFTYGMTVIFGIIFFNENQSFKIFEYLTNDKIYYLQKYFFIPYLLTLTSILYFIYLSFYEIRIRYGIVEIIFLLLIFYIFDPLLSFAIYFCFFHTYKHLKHLIKNVYLYLPNKKFVLYTTIIFTIISWFGGIITVTFLVQNFAFYESILKVIFIGLAALTLPHMILVDFVYRQRYK